MHVSEFSLYLIVGLAVENPKNSQEEVDDVQVQGNCGSDLFLDVIMPHDQLRINQNISTEDQRGETSVDELSSAIVWEPHRYESEQDEPPKPTE